MTTIILGLSALTICFGYALRIKDKEIDKKEKEINNLKKVAKIKRLVYETDIIFLEEKQAAENENWKQTSSVWILEKEELINKLTNEIYNRDKKHAEFKFDSDKKLKELEQQKFDQLHELALMLNDSYDVDDILLKKAEKFDWLVNVANREQKRNFIKGCEIK